MLIVVDITHAAEPCQILVYREEEDIDIGDKRAEEGMGCIAAPSYHTLLLLRVVPNSTMGMTGTSYCREPSSLDERCSCEVVVVVGIAVLSSTLVTSVAFVLVVCVRSCCESSDGCGHWDEWEVDVTVRAQRRVGLGGSSTSSNTYSLRSSNSLTRS